MFIAAKPATARQRSQACALRRPLPARRAAARTDGRDSRSLSSVGRICAGSSAPSRPGHVQTAVGEIEPRLGDAGQRFTAPSMRPMQPPQVMPSTARSMPSVPSRVRLGVKREVDGVSVMRRSLQRHPAARAEHAVVAAIEIDDQFPLARLRRRVAVERAGADAAQRQWRGRAARRPDARAARSPVRPASGAPLASRALTSSTASPAPSRASLPSTLPVQRLLALGRGHLRA